MGGRKEYTIWELSGIRFRVSNSKLDWLSKQITNQPLHNYFFYKKPKITSDFSMEAVSGERPTITHVIFDMDGLLLGNFLHPTLLSQNSTFSLFSICFPFFPSELFQFPCSTPPSINCSSCISSIGKFT